VLADDKYRARLLRKCTDKETRQTWTEFEAKDARQQAQEIGSLQNKVAALADPLPLRYVLGQPTSTIDFEKVIKLGTVFIIDLSDLGDEPAAILGAIIINAFKQAADAVGDYARPYRLYIDEFQNFGTSIISTNSIREPQARTIPRARASIHFAARRGDTGRRARQLLDHYFIPGRSQRCPHYWKSYQS
jgi:hypothetical protein